MRAKDRDPQWKHYNLDYGVTGIKIDDEDRRLLSTTWCWHIGRLYSGPNFFDGLYQENWHLDRIIATRMGIPTFKTIWYLDGDKKNVRRDNLIGVGELRKEDGVILDPKFEGLLEDISFSIDHANLISTRARVPWFPRKRKSRITLPEIIYARSYGLDALEGGFIAHKNRDSLDNRVDNLIKVPKAYRSLWAGSNKGLKGVECLERDKTLFRARIDCKAMGVSKRKQPFLTEEEAGRVYDELALTLLPKDCHPFVYLNFPEEPYKKRDRYHRKTSTL